MILSASTSPRQKRLCAPALFTPFAALTIGAFGLSSTSFGADTFSDFHESTFTSFSDSTSYSSDTPPEQSWFLFDTNLIGPLPKFDPSLGTLSAITLTISGNYGYEAELVAEDFIDTDQPHTASMDLEGFELGVFYQPTGENFITSFDLVNQVVSLSISNQPSDNGPTMTSTSVSDSFSFTINVFGDPSLNLNDFQGSGNVTGLRIGFFVPTTAAFNLENVTMATGMVSTFMEQGYISVDYTYAIPEPSSYALVVGLVAVTLAAQRRRRGPLTV